MDAADKVKGEKKTSKNPEFKDSKQQRHRSENADGWKTCSSPRSNICHHEATGAAGIIALIL